MSRKYLWLFLALAAVSLFGDLGSKYYVFKWLYPLQSRDYDLVPGWFKFTAQFDTTSKPSENQLLNSLQTWSAPEMPYVNKGALFGFLGNHKELANGMFALISALAAFAILIWVLRSKITVDPWLAASLGLIFGGAIGNCFDRIVFQGVRDFLYFYWFEWPVFNFADCCLVVGTAILVVHSLFVSDLKPAVDPVPQSTQPKSNSA